MKCASFRAGVDAQRHLLCDIGSVDAAHFSLSINAVAKAAANYAIPPQKANGESMNVVIPSVFDIHSFAGANANETCWFASSLLTAESGIRYGSRR
jgi:hypothetical protein